MENIFLDTYNNMVTKEWTKNGITLQMSWNSENRMTESTILNASTGGKSITRYKYDHEGNRVVKSGRYGEAVYVNQNYSVRNNTIVSKHIFAGGQRVVSKVCDSDANSIMDTGVFYVSTDHLGSTNVLTDDTGGFYEHIETFPDGGLWVREGTNNYDLPFQFTNHTKDLETMLFYAKARYYDAQLGRFISVDPIIGSYLDGKPNGGVYKGSNLNMYIYCSDNPVKYVDPDGKWDRDPIDNPEIVSHFNGVYNPSKSVFALRNRGYNRSHGGVDLRSNIGESVFAPQDGQVVDIVGNKNYYNGTSFGNKVVLKINYNYGFFERIADFVKAVFTQDWLNYDYKSKYDGKTLYLTYAHLDSVEKIHKGQWVKSGAKLGTTGKSGNAWNIPKYQRHLHFSASVKRWPSVTNSQFHREPEGTSWIDPAPFFNNLNMKPKNNKER